MTKTNKVNTICYKTSQPVVFNKGTEWETSEDTFLAYYTYKNDADAQAEADQINAEKPEKLFNGEPAKCNERFYFVNKQNTMN